MSLHKGRRSEIPKDAIVMNEQEALQFQINFIKDWKDKKDTWIFRHSFTILSSMTALTSIYINSHYRNKFKLLSYGKISTYLPIVIIPSMFSSIFHQQLVTYDVLLQKSCPVCIQIRSASIQALSSTVVPTIMAPLSAIPLAIRYFTYNIPPITKEPKKVFELLLKQTKPIGNVLMGLMLFNGLIGSFVAYQETSSYFKLQSKIQKMEMEIDNESNQLIFQ